MAKSLRCRVGWHAFVRRSSDDGQRYLACRRCGKVTEPGWTGGMG